MCGIVGYVGNMQAQSILLDGLEKLEYRGYDSAGVAIFDGRRINIVKEKGRLSELENKLAGIGGLSGTCGIGHTRWATHGEPSDYNSHPHFSRRVTLVHNGIIENYLDLKKILIDKGFVFTSQTDSETVAHLIDLYYESDPLAAISKALKEVRGSYALGILFEDQPETIYAVRKDSPLIIGVSDEENFIASDIPAVLKYTRQYILPENGEIAVVKKDQIRMYREDLTPFTPEILTANWDLEAAQKGGFDHFMLKEIFEQPEALMKTVSPRIKDGIPSLIEDGIDEERLKAAGKIHIIACGTAMHAGLIGKQAMEHLARVPVDVQIASEFRYNDPILEKNDAAVIISQSGETADTLAALRLCKERGIYTIAIVNVMGSSIAREADGVIYTWAGPEIAVASTKAYTVQMGVLYLLTLILAKARGTLTDDEIREYVKTLLQIPDQMRLLLSKRDTVKEYALHFSEAESLFFLGRGIDYALANEGSLKLKEISYIHCEAYAAGELKHGTISLITEGTPVIALATQAALSEKMVSNIKEVKSRGADVLTFALEGVNIPSEVTDYLFEIPKTKALLTPLLAVIPLQLFAYYTAVERGCDVDKPRNLAKSVTVE